MESSGLVVTGYSLNFVLRSEENRNALVQPRWLNIQDAMLAIGGSTTRLLDDERDERGDVRRVACSNRHSGDIAE